MNVKKSKYAELVFALKALEDKIFLHASLGQHETVQSFLLITVRKAKLENEIVLIPDQIIDEKIYIMISAQNEIPNIDHVDKVFTSLSAVKFNYLRFMKYVEFLSSKNETKSSKNENDTDNKTNDEKSNKTNLDDLMTTIKQNNKEIFIKVCDLKFHVARYGSDEYGRSIKLCVYTDEIVDQLLRQTPQEDHWIPDPNLFYLLDRVFGEYYMTKYISTINFFPIMIMPNDTVFLSAEEAKRDIDMLLGIDNKYCSKCNIPEYRTKLIDPDKDNNYLCINCKVTE